MEEDKKDTQDKKSKKFNIYTVIRDIVAGKDDTELVAGNIFEAFGFKRKKKDEKKDE